MRGRLGRPKPPAQPPGPPEPQPYPWEATYPEGIDWHAQIPTAPVQAILDDAVEKWPERPCLAFLGKKYTYAQVGKLVARAARGFQDIGVSKGVRVGLFLPNSPYYVVCYYAILKAGGTVVNYNPLYAEREIARQVKDSDTRIMVTLQLTATYPKLAGLFESTALEKVVVCPMGDVLPLVARTFFTLFRRKEIAKIPDDERHVEFDELIDNKGDYVAAPVEITSDIAVLQYTGGTTGLPKGAMLTHANLYANTVQTRMWAVNSQPGVEKILGVLPLFHVFGMTGVMNVGLYLGAEIILVPRFKLADVLAIIDKEKPTAFLGVPMIYSAINEYDALDEYDLSSLKDCISGGAPLPVDVKLRFEELTGCVLVEGYGLSEASPVCTINPFSGVNKPGSIGMPVPGTIVEIASLDNPDELLPPGKRGEICVIGPQVMAGYWNQPDETEGAFRGGRLHTGDVGYIDEEGYVFLIDRIKDLILNAGFNVYPRMVEEAIYLHPDVAEVVVCGVPDKQRGELVKAYVKRRAGSQLKAGELKRFLRDKLAPYAQPRRIEFRDELPKTFIGKHSRRELVAEEVRRFNEGLPPLGEEIEVEEIATPPARAVN
ncbi:MAG: long-chain fatty acid--CoA ligase [Rhodospirillales bacterium]|nr:MAG: long-chain fatty acid--CoA ligase [Rhodospirillales bacterium]